MNPLKSFNKLLNCLNEILVCLVREGYPQREKQHRPINQCLRFICRLSTEVSESGAELIGKRRKR
jgi:hypothetical protein